MDITNNTKESAKTLYSTNSCSFDQCDRSESFNLKIFGRSIDLKIFELIVFKNKICSIDLMHLISSSSPDLEIIYLRCSNQLFVFSIFEILELRELLKGGFAMMVLNSLIHNQLVRKII